MPHQDNFFSLGPHGFHKVAYVQWGAADNRNVAICVHGLTRNGRDFDVLAKELSRTHMVVCPDIAGRGRSDWLLHPEDYGYPVYLSDMAALLARLRSEEKEVDWVGTSMGGLIGMMIAAQPNSPIRRLVLNDVGPLIPKASLERIGTYVGATRHFESEDDAERYLREVHAPFGDLSNEQWRHLAAHSVRRDEGGGLTLHYDPAIGKAFEGEMHDVDLWHIWREIDCPVMVMRGENSDLLLADTVEQMIREKPDTVYAEIARAGHAPALMADDQVDSICKWLRN
ncbi:MAG: alpha/beta hydrolase [Rhodospirillales bacterium]|nr:alpha/beta hydrolase [Rhodospirillales bacterium]